MNHFAWITAFKFWLKTESRWLLLLPATWILIFVLAVNIAAGATQASSSNNPNVPSLSSEAGSGQFREPETCNTRVSLKIDCHPEPNGNEAECLRRNCCWRPNKERRASSPPLVSAPSCFFPSNFNCFSIKPIVPEQATTTTSGPDEHTADSSHTTNSGGGDSKSATNVLRWLLTRRAGCPMSLVGLASKQIEVQLSLHGDSLINIKISEPDRPRFEPNLPELSLPKTRDGQCVRYYDEQGTEWLRTGTLLAGIRQASGRGSGGGRGRSEKDNGNSSLAAGAEHAHNVSDDLLGDGHAVLVVIHATTGVILFEIDLGKLIYSRPFIQLPTIIPSPFIYGLGQHMGASLLKSSQGEWAKSYTMFNYGHPPDSNGRTAYSSYPFYINFAQLYAPGEDNSKSVPHFGQVLDRKLLAIGALMLNSNAMEVLVHSDLEADNDNNNNDYDNFAETNNQQRAGLTWRLFGGLVDLYLFAGPEPHDVVRQFQELVGAPTLPPPWALGYHQSRYMYRDLMSIKLAWAKTRSSGIPLESIWTDIEFLSRGTSYTVNEPELNEFVKILQNDYGMHYVAIVDPAISVDEDLAQYEALKLAKSIGLFAAYPSRTGGESSTAVVTTWTDSKRSALIDFTHPRIVPYLKLVLEDYRSRLNFDGLWLDMNEPEVFANEPPTRGGEVIKDDDNESCPYDERLPYEPGERRLNDRTLCMEAEFFAGKHQDIHNIYAFYQSKAHHEAILELNYTKRPFLLSRAQFPGQSKYSGTWLGDLGSTFEYMRWSLIGVIESNWFGQPFVGADICGFYGSTTDELCARWFSLGAFYPFARNHNGANYRDQDPGSLSDTVQQAARVALMRRYSLLPYLYSLFYKHRLKGQPVVRSVLFEFFGHFNLKENLNDLPQIDDQFMWGSGLMFAPIMHESSEHRSVYLPKGLWYDLSIGLPGTSMDETGLYDGLLSNWPLKELQELDDESAKQRRLHLRKVIGCEKSTGCWLEHLYTPLGAINVYQRGGSIIPTFRRFNHAKTVSALWDKPSFFLEVALDASQSATGSLTWDDGQSDVKSNLYSEAGFWVSESQLTVSVIVERSSESLRFDGFVVYGVRLPNNGTPPESTIYKGSRVVYSYDSDLEILSCDFLNQTNDELKPIELKRFESIQLSWA